MTRDKQLVALMFAISFLVMGTTKVFTAAAAQTLFLQAFGAKALPWIYIGTAVTVPLWGWAFVRLGDRLSFRSLMIAAIGIDAAMLILLRIGLAAGGHGTLGAVLTVTAALWYAVELVVDSLVVWGLAIRLFTVRESRRSFSIIGSGEILAAILCGLGTPLIVRVVGTANLLLCSAVSLLAGAVLVYVVIEHFARHLALRTLSTAAKAEERTSATAGASGRNYVIVVFALATVTQIAFYAVDNLFYAGAHERYADEASLSSFLGVFFAAVGILSLVTRLAFSRFLLERLGIRLSLLVRPILLLCSTLGTVLVAMGGNHAALFWLTNAGKYIDRVTYDIVYRTSGLMLYQPLGPRQRLSAQTQVESIVQPIAGGAAGIGLLLLTQVLHVPIYYVAIPLTGVLVLWIVLGNQVTKLYAALLRMALERREVRRIGAAESMRRMLVVKEVDVFASLQQAEMAAIAERLSEVDVPPGERIIERGEFGTSLYIIVDGKVRVHVEDRTLAVLGAHHIVGELTVFDPEPRSASVTAIDHCKLYRLEHRDLDDVMDLDVEVGRSVIKMLCRRIRDTQS